MGQATEWTDLDDLLCLYKWLSVVSDDALAQAVPDARMSRSEMLANLDDLIELVREGR